MPSPTWIHEMLALAASEKRLGILAYLAENPAAFSGDIADAVGIKATTLPNMLRTLEDEGLISGDIPRDKRAGRSVRWSLETKTIARILRTAAKKLNVPPPT